MAEGVLELTDDNFEAEVLESEQPVLVDFWAPWCGPCRALAPTIEELAGEYSGKVRVGKLNTDENPQMAVKYGISGLPAVLLFKAKEEATRVLGLNPKQKYDEIIAQHV